MSVNHVMLVGRLGNKPEAKAAGQSVVVSLSVATDRFMGKGKEKGTDWHRVKVWGKMAESCAKFLDKGDLVGVIGEVHYDTYTKGDVKCQSCEIRADRVEFLSTKKNRAGAGAGGQSEPEQATDHFAAAASVNVVSEEAPF